MHWLPGRSGNASTRTYRLDFRASTAHTSWSWLRGDPADRQRASVDRFGTRRIPAVTGTGRDILCVRSRANVISWATIQTCWVSTCVLDAVS